MVYINRSSQHYGVISSWNLSRYHKNKKANYILYALCADLQKTFFSELWNFKSAHLAKKRVNYDKFKIATNNLNQIFILNTFFFFLLTGAKWYYYTIYLVFTYFASFTDYEDDIFETISNLHVQRSKFGGKKQIWWKIFFKKLNSTVFMKFVFSKSGRLGNKHFFVNSEILRTTNCLNQIFILNTFFFSFWQVLNDITLLLT